MVLILTVLLGTAPSFAATLNITGISGKWVNSQVSSHTRGPLTGQGTNQIRWGTAANANTTRSGYLFAKSGPITQVGAGSFLLGRFTHKNGTIWSNSVDLRHSDLSLNLSGTADGQAFTLSSAFRMFHRETQNGAPVCPAGGRPCGDLIGILGLSGAPLVITQGNTVFTIIIDGFVRKLGGKIVNHLITPENRKRSLFLQASVQVTTLPPPPPVPLPAAGWLLVGAVGALAALRRRRA